MKKFTIKIFQLAIILCLLINFSVFAQIPEKMSYQAVVRDTDNELVKNTNISIKVSILKSTKDTSVEYEEIHLTTTNNNGLASIIIGDGETTGKLTDINWPDGIYYIKTEIDLLGGDNYTISNISQIISVPYALHSKTTESIREGSEAGNLYYWDGNKWAVIEPGKDKTALIICNGIPTWGGCDEEDEPIFVIENKDGINVFSVFEDGVNIIVSDHEDKTSRGGFAVGGFTAGKDFSGFFLVNPDSVRVYIKTEEETKGALGGFGVGSIKYSKNDKSDTYFRVTSDSTLIITQTIIEDDIQVGGDISLGGTIIYRPTVNTLAVTIIDDLIYLEGHVTSDGGGVINETGFYYATSSNPEISGIKIISEHFEDNMFYAYIDAEVLSPGATYFVKAFARNNAGAAFGQNITFNTEAILAEVITNPADYISYNSANAGGEVINDGGASVSARGVVWSQSPTPSLTLNEGYTNDGTGIGAFTSEMDNLDPVTTYYYRAYATNAIGTAYGVEDSFTTTNYNIYVEFYVYDSHASEPIENAMITIEISEGEFDEIFTDTEGYATIILPSGEYTYFVEAINYQSVESQIVVDSNIEPVIIYLHEIVKDFDENEYLTIWIGDQKWISSNLQTTSYNDGETIITGLDNLQWENTLVGAYAVYPIDGIIEFETENDMINAYGLLYNYHAVETNKLCPAGWNVPTEQDWHELGEFLEITFATEETAGLLKDTRTEPDEHPRWDSPNVDATNLSGFSGLPAGSRLFDGEYINIGSIGAWWSSNLQTYFYLESASSFTGFVYVEMETHAVSVRCIWDKGMPKILTPELPNLILDSINLTSQLIDLGFSDDYPIIKRGFSISNEPDFSDETLFTDMSNELGEFSHTFQGLIPGTMYYARAFVENEFGFKYSDIVEFKTYTIKDINDNIYDIIDVEGYHWMSQNFNATSFNDGEPIPENWYDWYKPAYFDSPANELYSTNDFGAFYNGFAVETAKLCPAGWHVPSVFEFMSFIESIGGVFDGYNKIKATEYWEEPNNATNETGFSFLPSGMLIPEDEFELDVSIMDITLMGALWTSSSFMEISELLFYDEGHQGTKNYPTILSKNKTRKYPMDDIYNYMNFSVNMDYGVEEVLVLGMDLQHTTPLFFGLPVRCLWNNGLPKVKRPAIATEEIIDDVILSSTVFDAGGFDEFPLISRGFALGFDTLPTIEDGMYFKEMTDELGEYSGVIEGLDPGETYHVRAFAENELGIYYSEGIKFKAYTVKDVDYNKYDIAKIGEQYWMGTNLQTRSFNNKIGLTYIDGNNANSPENRGIAYYSHNPYSDFLDNSYEYGYVYSYSVVDDTNNNICPVGWRVPTVDDWDELIFYLDPAGTQSSNIAGANMKTHDEGFWNTDFVSIDDSGFNAYPSGYAEGFGYYEEYNAHFWSVTYEEENQNQKTSIFLSDESDMAIYSYGETEFGRQAGLSIRCIMHQGEPLVATLRIKDITTNSAKSGGAVIFERGSVFEDAGIVWDIIPNPTTEINEGLETSIISGQEFHCSLGSLEPNTEYFVRAFVTIDGVTYYGNETSFITYHSIIADIEGNEYFTIEIGDQMWMAENLRTFKYNDGSDITYYSPDDAWQDAGTDGAVTEQQLYDEGTGSYFGIQEIYGALYNWYAAIDSRGICPTGWHVPTKEEWNKLIIFVDPEAIENSNIAGGLLKSNRISPDYHPRWAHPNESALDAYGFSAIPGGWRKYWGDQFLQLENLGTRASLWSSSDTTDGFFYYNMGFWDDIVNKDYTSGEYGMSVRCIRTELPVEEFQFGDGSEADPYQVANAAQLNNVRNYPDAYFVQTDDIYLDKWPWDVVGWLPIGDEDNHFTGNYDGSQFFIYGLTINKPENDYLGLFGYVSNAAIDSVGLINVNILGNNFIGGLAGYIESSIINKSFTHGVVEGNSFIGGFAGAALNSASIYNSYSITSTTGSDNIGGFIGNADQVNILHSYSAGLVSGETDTGGFIGSSANSIVQYCYWDIDNSEQELSSEGTGLPIMDMLNPDSYEEWIFGDSWLIYQNETYPFLQWQMDNIMHNYPPEFAGGEGTPEDPFLINTAFHLNNVRNYLGEEYSDVHFLQTADIDLGVAPWNESEGWLPIGEYDWEGNFAFMGNFDGGGFVIDGLFIDRDDSNQGLFGYAMNASLININMTNVSITANYSTGSLLGEGQGIVVSNCQASGYIKGDSNFGGLIGVIYDFDEASSIDNCSFTGNIDADNSLVGGLIGYVSGSEGRIIEIYNSFYSGHLNALGALVGGFMGEASYAYIQNCYNEGTVYSGSGDSGGFIAYIYDTTINECYSTADMSVEINGACFSGGFIGMVNSDCIVSNSYTTGTFIGDNHSGGFIGFLDRDTYVVNSFNTGDSYFYDGCGGGCGHYNGGFIGWAERAVVENCFNYGNVIGTNQIGGFIGYSSDMIIKNSFSIGSVEGINNIGGLIGQIVQNSLIENCYSAGLVTATSTGGGLIGVNNNSIVNYSFYDKDLAGIEISAGGIGKTTAEMKDLETYVNVGWDFKGFGGNNLWNLGNDRNEGYPYFNYQFPEDEPHPDTANDFLAYVTTESASNLTTTEALLTGNILFAGNPWPDNHGFCINTSGNPTILDDVISLGVPDIIGEFTSDISTLSLQQGVVYYLRAFANNATGISYGDELVFALAPNGEGTIGQPYLITSLGDLTWIAVMINEDNTFSDNYFRQEENIDASITSSWYNGKGWKPIGVDYISSFRGNYDGNFNMIEGLSINRPDEDYLGLFGSLFNANINNLGLIDFDILGRNYIGAMAGYLWTSHISTSFSTGVISGIDYVGGLTALNNSSSSVVNSYSIADVTGIRFVGGLISNNSSSSITRCYSAGLVSGETSLGGLVASSNVAATDSYWNTETSGLMSSAASATGLNTVEMTSESNFFNWDFVGVWDILETETYPFFQWQEVPGEYNYPNVSELFNVEFYVYDFITTFALEGASIEIVGFENLFTDSEGFAEALLPEGFHNIIVTYFEHEPYHSEIYVYEGITEPFNIELYEAVCIVEFEVVDADSGMPLQDVEITLDLPLSQQPVTDVNGKVFVPFPVGNYNIEIIHLDYESYEDGITIEPATEDFLFLIELFPIELP